MKGLEMLSVKGLRWFQNVLIVTGFILIPFVMFVDSLFVKALLSFSFLSIFWGFRKAEKLIGQKTQNRRKKLHEMQKKIQLHETCVKLIQHIEDILVEKGYSIEKGNNPLIDDIYHELSNCETVMDYRLFKNKIEYRIMYVASLPREKRQQKTQSQKTGSTTSPAYVLAQSLRILGLPEGTKDMIVIKNAYKKLIKQYHPDINSSPEAGKKTVQLNLAYEQIKKCI